MRQRRSNSTILMGIISMGLLLSLERELYSKYFLLYDFHELITFVGSFSLEYCKELIILIKPKHSNLIIYAILNFRRILPNIFFQIFNPLTKKAMVSPSISFL